MAEYIEREALEAAFREVTKKEVEFYGYYNLLCFPDEAACEIAREIPAADVVERKRGRWIWDDNAMDWGLGGWVCSECQEKNDNIPAKPDINPYGWVGSFYCPNCGCLMGGD